MQDHSDRNYRDLVLALQVLIRDSGQKLSMSYLTGQGATLYIITRQLY